MRLSKPPRFLTTVLGLLTLAIVNLTAHGQALGATESVLWNFGGGADGQEPWAGLIMDTNGNLYGTTLDGGANGGGVVFELSPQGNESILWSFGDSTSDGSYGPYAGVIMDTGGNLYGTITYG